jgi:hypothetical protein
MAKVYLLNDADIERLRAAIDRDPDNGFKGGGSQHLSQQERDAHREAHRFFNYQVCTWIDGVTK